MVHRNCREKTDLKCSEIRMCSLQSIYDMLIMIWERCDPALGRVEAGNGDDVRYELVLSIVAVLPVSRSIESPRDDIRMQRREIASLLKGIFEL